MDANTWTTVSYSRSKAESNPVTKFSQGFQSAGLGSSGLNDRGYISKFSSFNRAADKPAWVAAEEKRAHSAIETEKKRVAVATSFTSDDVYPTLGRPSVAGGGGKPPARHYAKMVAEMAAREQLKAIEKVREENIKRYSMDTAAHKRAAIPTRAYDMGSENIDEYADEEDVYAPIDEQADDVEFNTNLFKGY